MLLNSLLLMIIITGRSAEERAKRSFGVDRDDFRRAVQIQYGVGQRGRDVTGRMHQLNSVTHDDIVHIPSLTAQTQNKMALKNLNKSVDGLLPSTFRWPHQLVPGQPTQRLPSVDEDRAGPVLATPCPAVDLHRLMAIIDGLTAAIGDVKQQHQEVGGANVSSIRHRRGANGTEATTEQETAAAPTNATDAANSTTAAPGCEEKNLSGRRSMPNRTGLVKEKLLLYLEEGFQDVEDKVVSLEEVKRFFAGLLPYKVGYMVANVDTLAVNMRSLREDARVSADAWGEPEILDAYDRLKTSSSLITKLLDTLRTVAEKRLK